MLKSVAIPNVIQNLQIDFSASFLSKLIAPRAFDMHSLYKHIGEGNLPYY